MATGLVAQREELEDLAITLRTRNPDRVFEVDDAGVWLRDDGDGQWHAVYATLLGGGIVQTLTPEGVSYLRRPITT